MEKIKYEELLHRGKGSDVLLYKQGDSTPYTGKATILYKNGQMKFEGVYKNGALHGIATWWHRDGKKEYEATYINGKMSEILMTALIPNTHQK